MTILHAGTVLTPEERLARRKLIIRDAISLVTLFLITAVIFALTLLLHRSFEDHREELGNRWRSRGELALQQGHPKQAVEALRSALAYVPNRQTEVDLATALADAGNTVEATAYFNTLWDSAPGDAIINLQLARLAVKAGNEPLAVRHYQAAIDGTWQGNGFDRRREVRLELARYYISRRQLDQARTQLLIATSNAPDNPPAIKLGIAGLLEQANDLPSALGVYRAMAAHRPIPVAALEGAGRTAFHLGMYRVASGYLGMLIARSAITPIPDAEKNAARSMLDMSNRILVLYPGYEEPARVRAQRILALKGIANKRLTTCASNPAAAPHLGALTARWGQLPSRLTAQQLEQQPDLEQSILQLVFDTETTTAQTCGAPSGDDALLLRIAQNPGAVEQD
ncbi:MAG TPA: tetratricopeptide repeat protein [Acidobacteriaceae bacterium]|nr:tetratricopeptide repeat protein [Acidobacteriaceae bacterium]